MNSHRITNPVHRILCPQVLRVILLAIVAVLLVWYLVADRLTPWTDQARVQAWIVPVAPKVSGKIKNRLTLSEACKSDVIEPLLVLSSESPGSFG